MPFDGFFIHALVNELNHELAGSRIERIYQPDKHDLVIVIRRQKGNCRLAMSANARWSRFHLTREKHDNQPHPRPFCMFLRKYLEGAKIIGIEQPGWERIIKVRLLTLNNFHDWTELLLIGEFMGRHSNIILVDPQTNTILDAIKRYGSDVSSYREVLPGAPYVSPPSQNKMLPHDVTPESLWSKWLPGMEDKRIAEALFASVEGLSPVSSRYICQMAGIDPHLLVEECGELELTKVYMALKSTISRIKDENISPGLVSGSMPSDFWIFPLGKDWENTDSINEAADRYFTRQINREQLMALKANLGRALRTHLDRLYRKLAFQEEDLKEAQRKEYLRIWGELLIAYAHEIPRGSSTVILNDFYTGEPVAIELKPHLSGIENAQKYFREYAKARIARDHLLEFIKSTRQEIEYLETVQLAVEKAETTTETEEIMDELSEEGYLKENCKGKNKRGEIAFRQFTSSDGYQILVGKNNRQNDLLTTKKSSPGDLWLHAKDIPGTHVIVRLPETGYDINKIPDRTLTEAALLAAYYSRAREGGKVDVDYTFRRQVKKPKGARPGMVVYDGYWTITVDLRDPSLDRLLAQNAKVSF